MGLLGKIKGFLNIGGVSVKITKAETVFKREDEVMSGYFEVTTKTDRTILSSLIEFYMETTTGEGDEKKTSKTMLGNADYRHIMSDEYPFELAANETKRLHFMIIDINMEGTLGRMAQKGGLMGAAGKLGSLAKGMTADADARNRYFLEVTVDVEGSPFDPSDKIEIQVVPGSSNR